MFIESVILLYKLKYFIMKKFLIGLTGVSALATPFFAFAATTDATGLISLLTKLINQIIPFLIAVIVLMILIGLVMYATSADEEKQQKARKLLTGAILALVVFMVLWGIIRLIINTLDLNNTTPTYDELPCFDNPATYEVEC